MATKEVSVPYVVQDFNEGDTVWRQYFMENTFLFGKVTHTDADNVYAMCEDGTLYTVPIGTFGVRSKNNEIWGKLLDVSLLELGSRLSSKGGSERVFWEVVEYRPSRPGASGKIKLVSGSGSSEKVWEKSFGHLNFLKILMVGLEMEA